ncbi:hypothetical protein KY290_013422 [Solanum tuberosum]|uniref:Uncharacterized protein n=1 Tax=Solanum tuberosum TaxID=4113 RepID=A0ABQ7VMZ4_SOLTU|nr:hypothetical protein KY285_012884 [Solanum tuberosum]KAH0769441.1 hypothetical protein KY290_013422 [Solanum tuberosum]
MKMTGEQEEGGKETGRGERQEKGATSEGDIEGEATLVSRRRWQFMGRFCLWSFVGACESGAAV